MNSLKKLILILITAVITVSAHAQDSYILCEDTCTHIHGIDLSHYQGKVFWETVGDNTKMQYVYLKATEGGDRIDDKYEQNIELAHRYGLKVGSYHFFRPKSELKKQLENFKTQCRPGDQDLIPMIDVESTGGLSTVQFCDSLMRFLEMVEEAYRQKPLIYTGRNFYNKHLQRKIDDYPLMVAMYANEPPVLADDRDYLIWQYTAKGRINGINTYVDKSMLERPFRSPHHSLSTAALVGGGKVPLPGEISLAHNGVLFLDEFPEFKKDALEALRQPIEDKEVTITRAAGRVTYPSAFMMVCAMNPCRCGYYGSRSGKCTCKPADIKLYLSRISGPMLDRIDIQVEMPELNFNELSDEMPAETSAEIRVRVEGARELSRERFKAAGIENWSRRSNALMGTDELREFCSLDDEGRRVMENVFSRTNLSARAYDRILRVARTLADLEAVEQDKHVSEDMIGGRIKKRHLTEAAQMRALDRKYW